MITIDIMANKAKKSSVRATRKSQSAPEPKAASKAKATPKAKGATGKRYSNEEKAEIIQFVEAFNAQNGRGGQTAAVRKFGISQLSLAAWLKANRSGGLKSGTKASGSSLTAKLASLSMLHGDITRAEKMLQALKAKFDALRASL